MDTYGTDTKVDTLEVLGTVDVEARIENTTLLARLHGAGTERVPSGLDVVSDPVIDGLVVLFGVLDVVVDLASIVHIAGLVPRT